MKFLKDTNCFPNEQKGLDFINGVGTPNVCSTLQKYESSKVVVWNNIILTDNNLVKVRKDRDTGNYVEEPQFTKLSEFSKDYIGKHF